MNLTDTRLHVVDALRGFAIVSIMLLHNVEHFDIYFKPTDLQQVIVSIDQWLYDAMFFLFGGKSYAIFALLFGVTFFIQNDNQQKKGNDFRLRFAWRMVILLCFGMLNTAFYQGDILTIYAIIGFFLIPMTNLSNKAIFWSAVFLMLQPYEISKVLLSVFQPDTKLANPPSWIYFGKMNEYITGDSFIKTIIGNLTNGKLAVLNWNWENGRFFQTLSLFLLGILAGRLSLFANTDNTKLFWRKTLIFSCIMFVPLFILRNKIGVLIDSEGIKRPLSVMLASWANLAFMLILVSGFVLLFRLKTLNRILNKLSPIGRMSMSNYIMQSVLGAFIYYGFGLGLYKYTGATYCIAIGIILAILLGYFSAWWTNNNKYGPLESIWHKLTWIRISNSKQNTR